MTIPKIVPLACACIAIGLLAGCGSDPNVVPVYPTTGTLTMGGKPFGPTLINLRPMKKEGRMVVGQVDKQGEITFTTFERGDGAPAGKYRVMVATRLGPPPRPMPKVYRSQQSPLMVTVEKSENKLNIKMNPKAGPLTRASAAAKRMSAAQLPTTGSTAGEE